MTHRLRCLATTLLLVAAGPVNAAEKFAPPNVEMVRAEMEMLARALNKTQDRMAGIKRLDSHIADDARFTVSTRNPAFPAAFQDTSFELDKASYINSFAEGLNVVSAYSVSIELSSYNSETGRGVTRMVERGTIRQHGAQPQDFTTVTICNTDFVLEKGRIRAHDSTCRSLVNPEESI